MNFSAIESLAVRAGVSETPTALYRSEFMRDRDRVLYSTAFRRLDGKTQIYLTGDNDHKRNRLTHTLEVSQIARTIAKALNLDVDLTEAIALAHDLGHAPFGHAGEQILHEIMAPDNASVVNITNSPFSDIDPEAKDYVLANPVSGFKHNIQGVRVAATIEDNYGQYGLNLTNYTLWGIAHHSSLTYKPGRVSTTMQPNYLQMYEKQMQIEGNPESHIQYNEAWSFEAFVVREADEIAQWHHDIEDALRSDAMKKEDVCVTLKNYLGKRMSTEDIKKLDELSECLEVDHIYMAKLSSVIINTLVSCIIEKSSNNLQALWNGYGLSSTQTKQEEDAKKEQFFRSYKWTDHIINDAIGFHTLDQQDGILAQFQKDFPTIISHKIHHSSEVERMNVKGKYVIRKLFQAYYSHPQQLSDSSIFRYMVNVGAYNSLQEAQSIGIGTVRAKMDQLLDDKSKFDLKSKILLMRFICDHIANMTDRYALSEYDALYG